jgi:hypothetical protein
MGVFPVRGYEFLKFEFYYQIQTVISPKQPLKNQRSTTPPCQKPLFADYKNCADPNDQGPAKIRVDYKT